VLQNTIFLSPVDKLSTMPIYDRQLRTAQEKRGPLVTYNFCVPPGIMHEMDRLVAKGLFVNRSEVLRYAITKVIEDFKEL